MLRLAARIAAGPFRVPRSYVVVRSSGTGKITARALSYWDSGSGIPPKLSGGIGVYRVIFASRSLFLWCHSRAAALPSTMANEAPGACVFQIDPRTNVVSFASASAFFEIKHEKV